MVRNQTNTQMHPTLIKLAKIVTQRMPDSSPSVARAGEFSLGDELYRDKVDPKEQARKMAKKSQLEKGPGKWEDLVIQSLGQSTRSTNVSPNTHINEPPARGTMP